MVSIAYLYRTYRVAIGGLFSLASFVGIVVKLIVGKAINRWGGKVFLLIGFGCYAVAMFLFSKTTDLMGIYISWIVCVAGSSMVMVSRYSVIGQLANNKNRGEMLGIIDGANSEGALYGMMLACIFFSRFRWEYANSYLFTIYAVIAIVGGGIVLIRLKDFKGIGQLTPFKIDFNYSKSYYKLMTINFVGAMAFAITTPILILYLKNNFSVDISLLPLIYLPKSLIYAYLPNKFGKVADRGGYVMPMSLGLIVNGVVTLFFILKGNIMMLMLLVTIEAIGGTIGMSAEKALLIESMDEGRRASGYSLYSCVGSVGSIVGPLIGGWLYDKGDYIPFVVSGMILVALGVLVSLLFKKRVRGV